MSNMKSTDYHEGYWEHGEGSNYYNYGNDPGWEATAGILANSLFRGAAVLEVACAKGYFVQAALREHLDCYGVDISEYALSQAPFDVEDRLSWANAIDIPHLNDSFDAVVSWEFLEHVYEDELDQVLSEFVRVSKTNAFQVHRICTDHETSQDDHTHVLVRPREYWEDKFSSLGWFRRKDVEESLDFSFKGRDWAGRFFAYNLGE